MLDSLRKVSAAFLLAIPMLVSSCEDRGGILRGAVLDEETSKAASFATDALDIYYLWTDEVQEDLARLDPDTCANPSKVVKEIRYHEDGAEVDHWTMLTNDVKSFKDQVEGIGVSYGYYLSSGKFGDLDDNVFLVVRYVCKGSPAEKAGLRRGDVIARIDGKPVTRENMYDAVQTSSVALDVTRLDYSGGSVKLGQELKRVRLVAERFYEDPILLHKVFRFDGKRVGYLVYNSFDLKSAGALPEVFRSFKEEGVREVILDLRYNSGGYAFTQNVLGSLLAPRSNVLAQDVFQTEVYNETFTAAFEKSGLDTDTRFSLTHKFDDGQGTRLSVDLADCDPGISKLWVIVTGISASASEGLVIGLKPYVDLTLVGTKTGGKYCSGLILTPDQLYKASYNSAPIKNWGIYVMVSKFADAFGRNDSIPDGLLPDIQCDDRPFEGRLLGDENESMLRAALVAAGWKAPSLLSARPQSPACGLEAIGDRPPLLLRPGSPTCPTVR